MKKIISIFFVVILLCIDIQGVFAQEFKIHGKITSQDNKSVENVYIKIYDENKNRIRDEKTSQAISTKSNIDGEFEFNNIKQGKYYLFLRKNNNFTDFILPTQNSEIKNEELIIPINVVSKDEKINIQVNGYIALAKDNKIKEFINKWEWQPITTSLKTAFVGIIFTFVLGLLLSRLILSIKLKYIKYILDAFLTLPLVLPPTVMGFFLLRFLGVNSFIGKLFLQLFDFKIVFSWESTVIASVVLSLPLMYRSTRGAIEQVDENLIFAAQTLGFSNRKIFWRILVPNAIPGIASATILSFARGLGEYGATSMIAGNILGKTRTLPIAVAVTTSAGQDDQARFYAIIIVCIAMVLITSMNIITLKISRKRR